MRNPTITTKKREGREVFNTGAYKIYYALVVCVVVAIINFISFLPLEGDVGTTVHTVDSVDQASSLHVLDIRQLGINSLEGIWQTISTATTPDFTTMASSFCSDALRELVDKFNKDSINGFRLPGHHLHTTRRICWEKATTSERQFLVDRTTDLWRQNHQSLYLHIPKSSGTTWCRSAKKTKGLLIPRNRDCTLRNDTVGGMNTAPRWCNARPQKTTCPRLAAEPYDMILNERFLDYNDDSPFCDRFAYAATIREPVERVWSQINHERRASFHGRKGKKLLTVQNYMTWSLAVGKFAEEDDLYPPIPTKVGTVRARPSQEWLPAALETLLGFDFINTLHGGKYGCSTKIMLQMLGVDMEIETKQNAREYNRTEYSLRTNITDDLIRSNNLLDIVIWETIYRLEESECDFLSLVNQSFSQRSPFKRTIYGF